MSRAGGAPTVFGPQPAHSSPASASPAVSPVFAGLLRNRWTSHSASPAPTAASPQAHPQARSIESAAHARQSMQGLQPADVASAVPCATTPPLAEAAAFAPVRDEQCTHAAATDRSQDGYPSDGDDYNGGRSCVPAMSHGHCTLSCHSSCHCPPSDCRLPSDLNACSVQPAGLPGASQVLASLTDTICHRTCRLRHVLIAVGVLCSGDDGGWCGSGDEGDAAGSMLHLNLSPPAAAASPSGGDTVATPPGLMPTVATPETRSALRLCSW